MISFQEARDAALVETDTTGLEDDFDYLVVPLITGDDDQVTFVRKSDGFVHREVYFEQTQKISRMRTVTAEPA